MMRGRAAVAQRSHNPQAEGSNPSPATTPAPGRYFRVALEVDIPQALIDGGGPDGKVGVTQNLITALVQHAQHIHELDRAAGPGPDETGEQVTETGAIVRWKAEGPRLLG